MLGLAVAGGAGEEEAAAHAVCWPECSLRWLPATQQLLRCELLVGNGGDDEHAEAEVCRRLRCAGVRARVLFASPLPLPVLPRSLEELQLPVDTPLSPALALLRSTGALLLPDSVSASELPALRALASRRVAAVEEALRERHLTPFRDDCAFLDAASRGRGRLEVRLPLAQSAACCSDPEAQSLLSLASTGPWARCVFAALRCGRPTVTASLVVSRPGAPAQHWHADGPHLRLGCAWATAREHGGCGCVPPHAMCVFLPLVDVTAPLGSTELWLGSHAWTGLVELAQPALGALQAAGGGGTRCVLQPCVRAATALLYDYRLVHRGAANAGQSDRPLLQFVYRAPTDDEGWEEGHNFGHAPCLTHALPPGAAWSVALHADASAEQHAAQGTHWWEQQPAPAGDSRCESVEETKQPGVPAASGWSVFD